MKNSLYNKYTMRMLIQEHRKSSSLLHQIIQTPHTFIIIKRTRHKTKNRAPRIHYLHARVASFLRGIHAHITSQPPSQYSHIYTPSRRRVAFAFFSLFLSGRRCSIPLAYIYTYTCVTANERGSPAATPSTLSRVFHIQNEPRRRPRTIFPEE